jgi:HEAT repeat protein
MACYFLARFETATNAIPAVLPLLSREKTRTTALYTLGHLRAREGFDAAMTALDDPSELVRLRAAQALGRIGDKRAAAKLRTASRDEWWDVRFAAEEALAKIRER